ncbi:AAA family ATPase [Streptomyces sp. NPDC059762]|uniref:AAA family ATPase n=1 Tax=Streptomyces sp. NPDC059762 TaxID=3346938 RepID=UPI0036653EC8
MTDAIDSDLVGREPETASLRRRLTDALDGTGGASVLLRGDAGIGKTALLDWAGRLASKRGFRVLRAVGSETEEGLAFGALQQVLGPLLAGSTALSAPRREALERALGVRAGSPAAGFAVGASALPLLAAAAREAPVLVLVDDLHWVDGSSAEVLAFLGRRISGVPVVMIAATRPRPDTADDWPGEALDIAALTPEAAGILLRRRHPTLSARTAERVLAEAGGNPLALDEIPCRLHADHQRGILPLPDQLPLSVRLERLFAERLEALTPEARRLLLLAALSGGAPTSDVGLWLRSEPDCDTGAVLDLIDGSGLAHVDSAGRFAFRHPLVRSAVVSVTPAAEKARAHRRLAEVLDVRDPRRLVHEAAAADGPAEDLAARLQEAAQYIARRGGDAEAALLMDRAATLSEDADARVRRVTWAAVMAARGGRLPYATRLVESLRGAVVPADVAPLYGYAVVYVDQSHRIDFASSLTLLPGALGSLAEPGTDPLGGLAEQVFFKLLLAAVYTGDAGAWTALKRHGELMSPLARLCLRAWADPPRTAHGAAVELAELAGGQGTRGATADAWLLLWTASAVDTAEAELWSHHTGGHTYATQGTIAKVRAHQDFLTGRWDSSGAVAAEAGAAEDRGYHCNALLLRLSYAHYLAGRGDEAGFAAVAEAIEPRAVVAGMRFVTDRLECLRALLALALGRPEEAYAVLSRLMPGGLLPRGLAWSHLALFDVVWAAVATGRTGEARAYVEAARAARIDLVSPHHAFVLAAVTALAAGEEEAEACFAAAYGVPGARRWVPELARLRLAHGMRLRASGRVREARDLLAAARQTFRDLGAGPWADRAAAELRAAGQAGGGVGDGAGSLTAQELRIARLAATGLTNKQIGGVLRLSPRTVGAHLHRIFPKLGITSRAALHAALPEP